MNNVIKVMLPAWQIPVGSTVTKRTGRKEYILTDRLTVYPLAGHGEKQEIRADDGVRFLVQEHGTANAIQGSLELVWITTMDGLQCFLHEQNMEDK